MGVGVAGRRSGVDRRGLGRVAAEQELACVGGTYGRKAERDASSKDV